MSKNYEKYEFARRIIDVTLSIIGSFIAIPLIAFFALLVYLETPGPVFYAQERLGLNGKSFNIYKIRSMRIDAEKTGAMWANDGDERVTRVGKVIRKTRIDELPQLLNILKNEMSLIGPRPERAFFYDEFEKDLKNFRDRLKVKPGLSGWAQVNGGYNLTPAEKLEYDLWYIENYSFKLDLLILIKTVTVIFTGEGAR